MTQPTVLTRIVASKAEWLQLRQQQQPLESFQAQLVASQRSFYAALTQDKTCFILECKKASPSKGLIRPDFDPRAIARIYSRYASAISVLTDEKYFQGSFDYLRQVSEEAPQPVLCKDFIIDPYQIYLARHYQADAILLMLSVLDDERYCQLADIAHSLNMGVLTEVSNREELERAIALQAQVVGINNRNLRDLSIDLDRTRQLATLLPDNVRVISESGIHTYGQIRQLSQYADGFLIGSALMAEPDLEKAVRRVTLGDNKVCGLTRPEDAAAAYQAGAVYGGLIFVEQSPRYVDIARARQVISAAPLQWIGVFRDAPLEEVCATARQLALHAVQLHGKGDADYISQLRQQLPVECQIWRACSIRDQLPPRNLPHIDRYLFDHGAGGSGKSFDWDLLKQQALDNVQLAGGITIDNIDQAAQTGCAGLDINSGAESQPGIKDHKLVYQLLSRLRDY